MVLLGNVVVLYFCCVFFFFSEEPSSCYPQCLYQFTLLPTVGRGFLFSTSSSTAVLRCLLKITLPADVRCQWYSAFRKGRQATNINNMLSDNEKCYEEIIWNLWQGRSSDIQTLCLGKWPKRILRQEWFCLVTIEDFLARSCEQRSRVWWNDIW